MGSATAPVYKFEAVKGFFMQSDAGVHAGEFDNRKNNFGLIDRPYETDSGGDLTSLSQWQRFAKFVQHLLRQSPPEITYKVVYAGRHGEGDRLCFSPDVFLDQMLIKALADNVAEAKYGTKAWDDRWSRLDGDGELYWFDAHLTAVGERQALDNHAFFEHQLKEMSMPAPQSYYVSPLYRCLQTANFTFAGLDLPQDRQFDPLIKELLREVMGEHTCDKRSTKSVILKSFPGWRIESGFTEEDELWQADHRETWTEHEERTQTLLDDIFIHDPNTFVSLTSHSGMNAALLRVLGHHDYRLPTGGLMPILVKATKHVR